MMLHRPGEQLSIGREDAEWIPETDRAELFGRGDVLKTGWGRRSGSGTGSQEQRREDPSPAHARTSPISFTAARLTSIRTLLLSGSIGSMKK